MLGKRLIAGFHHCTNSPCWSKSATPKHILGVSLSQLLRQWRSWRTGSAAYETMQFSAMVFIDDLQGLFKQPII